MQTHDSVSRRPPAHTNTAKMDAIAAQFGEHRSLYDVLEILPTATASEIKKAYFKIALKCHPDKCPGDEAAKGRFQALSLVHSVLSDPERRSLYDESGEVEEESHDDKAEEGDLWFDYWRNLFPKITVSDIESFASKYQGSDEEERDVLEMYKKHSGKMSAVVDSIMLATEADEQRFRDVIDLAIECEEVPTFAAFRKGAKSAKTNKSSMKRKAKRDKEAAEAEELVAMLKAKHEARKSTTSLSTHRAQEFDSMVASLEERYGGRDAGSRSQKKERKRGKKAPPPDIDDAEFERIKRQLEEGRSKR